MGNYVILARHGLSSADGKLSAEGEKQCIELATKIMEVPYCRSKPIQLISSTAPRAMESAGIIQIELNISDSESYQELWSDSSHPYSKEKVEFLKKKISKFLDENSHDNSLMIIVTHLEFVNDFLRDARFTPYQFDCGHGSGVILHDGQVEAIIYQENILEEKLDFLYKLLVAYPEEMPVLPENLKVKYESYYKEFCERIKTCKTSSERVYVEAQRKFRDGLLDEVQ